MRLAALLEEIDVLDITGDGSIEVQGLQYDSRRVRLGDAFFALGGRQADGRRFVAEALAAGAVAVVSGAPVEAPGAARVVVRDPRLALAQASAHWFGQPSRGLRIVGVTGTNGKTTTTWLLESVFRAAGWTSGVIGTTGIHLGDETRAAAFTTPEAPELQGLLREMSDRGIGAVAMELSSHALHQHRCHGVECDVAVFTNLSHDHLDYHGTLEAYLDAKLMLFDGRNQPETTKHMTAVIGADDPVAPQVRAAAARGAARIVGYGEAAGAEMRIADVAPRPGGLVVTLVEGGTAHTLALPLLGRYNAWNAAGAFAAARALGIDAATVRRGLEAVRGVPGRLERVVAAPPFDVVVDYAHTPDALARSLAAVREHARGRVLLVFGCGGDRDRAKRPVMGRLAREGSDRSWVTNDNPRSEDPQAIADAIVAGAGGGLDVVLDRREAIAAALAEAREGDVVLVAGKGHETTQTLGDQVLPFDDRVVVRELLARSGGRA